MEVIKRAPRGQFRIIGKDSPRDLGWRKGDYSTLEEATEIASSGNQGTVRYFVYDDDGECCFPEE